LSVQHHSQRRALPIDRAVRRAHIVYCNNYSTILRNDSLFLLKMLEI
jgi:hypothetical protein